MFTNSYTKPGLYGVPGMTVDGFFIIHPIGRFLIDIYYRRVEELGFKYAPETPLKYMDMSLVIKSKETHNE